MRQPRGNRGRPWGVVTSSGPAPVVLPDRNVLGNHCPGGRHAAGTRLPAPPVRLHRHRGPGLLAAPAQIKVAAFGDSLMWGQGLRDADKFKNLATRNFGILAGGKPASIVCDRSRSGAKISASVAERRDFVDIYPHLFTGQPVRVKDAFTAGTSRARASRLYGQFASTFPTVRAQVSQMPATLGRTIDVALVDGGLGRPGARDVVNPEKHSGSQFVRPW